MSEVQKIQKVERSPRGLVNAMFDTLDALNAGEITHDDARAKAHTVRSIVGVARLEMDAMRMADKAGKKLQFSALPTLGQGAEQITAEAPKS